MKTQIGQCFSQLNKGKDSVAGVAFPIAIPGIFDYRIPERFLGSVLQGTPVLVSVRKREVWGVAVAIKQHSAYPDLKEIIDIKVDRWANSSSSLITLYEWIARYYQCDLGRVFRPLVRKGLVTSSAKVVQVYSLTGRAPELLNKKYQDIIARLQPFGTFSAATAEEQAGVKRSALTYLLKEQYLEKTLQEVLRTTPGLADEVAEAPVILTQEQTNAVEEIYATAVAPGRPFLLYGITGSGKTHIYIELASRMLQQNRGVIILVPEIALTPQTIQRFRSALGSVVTVIHSHMSDGERRDSLQELVTGTKRVVIGVRSAIMAPINNIGLIIVDEEHDGSYKQSDVEPRYHARDVAVMRGHLQGALVVLGSATPSLESFQNALTGKYALIRLTTRFGAAALPRVTLVDMREEQRNNNWKPLSIALVEGITEALANKRQIILLLNRRGFSTVLLCKDCGYTAACPNCSVTLRYHRADTSIKCHICGFQQVAPDQCPQCQGTKIKYQGTGIQKIEEHLAEQFPEARVIRMDQDTTRKKGAHASILQLFAEHKADILLGTQMVAKGLNFPGVALVGVIAADTGLHVPDFRASERTFQLLTQVAGRAGRADSCGVVLIQTYSPDDPAVRAAEQHDYTTFFNQEVVSRQELGYPPWGRLARIVVVGRSEQAVIALITTIASRICRLDKGITILGPSPAVLQKIANESRYTLLLKAPRSAALGTVLTEVRRQMYPLPAAVKLIVDVDPVNML